MRDDYSLIKVSNERCRVEIIDEIMVVNFVKTAICEGCG